MAMRREVLIAVAAAVRVDQASQPAVLSASRCRNVCVSS